MGGWSLSGLDVPADRATGNADQMGLGQGPLYQLLLTMAPTTAAAVLFVGVASSIYRRALPITG